jgi:hypothetical protein
MTIVVGRRRPPSRAPHVPAESETRTAAHPAAPDPTSPAPSHSTRAVHVPFQEEPPHHLKPRSAADNWRLSLLGIGVADAGHARGMTR